MTPAMLLQTILLADSILDDPLNPQPNDTPCFLGYLPEDIDNSVALFDTFGRENGRLMAGPSVFHPGFQIRVRMVEYDAAYEMIDALGEYLDTINQRLVEIEGISYTIAAIRRQAPIPMGTESEGRRRTNFSLNGTLTLV